MKCIDCPELEGDGYDFDYYCPIFKREVFDPIRAGCHYSQKKMDYERLFKDFSKMYLSPKKE